MSVRTNTANGGTTYIDMDIQVVSADHDQYTLRAVIYLTSLNVTDSTNNCHVDGQWSRDGALSVGGVYNQNPIWYQDVSFGRQVGTNYTVGWNLSWSSVNYWGTTLSGTAYATVPATTGKPSTPYGYGARNITTSSAYTTGVSVADVAGGSWNNLWVRWSPNSNMAGYSERQMGSWTDGLMDGLSPGRNYYFQVAAANGYMWSDFGAVASFTSAAGVPGAPSADVKNITATSAHVYVATPGPENGASASYCEYVLYRNDGTLIGYKGGSAAAGIGYAGVVWDGLDKASPYRVHARTWNSAGWGAWTPGGTNFTTLSTVPATMAAPTVSAIGLTTATINYVAPSDTGGLAITGYTAQYATNAGFTTGVGTATSTTTTANLTGLTAGTPYWVRVWATTTAGSGTASPATAFSSGATVPSAPAAPGFLSITDNSATINWAAPAANGSPITEYHVNITATGFDVTLVSPSVGPFTINGLQPKTTYQFKVRAVNLQGPGAYSSPSVGVTSTGLGLNVSGTWKSGVELWMNVAGTWKYVTLYVDVGGAKKKIT